MSAAMRVLEGTFEERVRTPTWLARVAFSWSRSFLATLLAVTGPLVILLVAWWGPAEFARAVVDAQNVHQLFARLLTAVATASAIAVSVASLTIRREMRGASSLRDHQDDNEELRRRLRERAGLERGATVLIGPFLADVLEAIGNRARALRRELPRETLQAETLDVRLEDYLQMLERRAARIVPQLRNRRRASPDRVLRTVLDGEEDLTLLLARRYCEMDAPDEASESLRELRDLVREYMVLSKYAQTLDTEWGLSRMSIVILVATMPSIVASALMVLTWGDGAVDALGASGAALVVCAALALALFPLAAFVSYLVRFVFVHQHTLPSDAFLLGPEAAALARNPPETRSASARGRGSA